jgi:hypothetical protein
MKNLNEYNKKITSDEEFEKWKSTWDCISEPPKNVQDYIRTIKLPTIYEKMKKAIFLPNQK